MGKNAGAFSGIAEIAANVSANWRKPCRFQVSITAHMITVVMSIYNVPYGPVR